MSGGCALIGVVKEGRFPGRHFRWQSNRVSVCVSMTTVCLMFIFTIGMTVKEVLQVFNYNLKSALTIHAPVSWPQDIIFT